MWAISNSFTLVWLYFGDSVFSEKTATLPITLEHVFNIVGGTKNISGTYNMRVNIISTSQVFASRVDTKSVTGWVMVTGVA